MLIPRAIARHPVSVAGVALTTISAILFLTVFLLELFGFHANPYIGIVVFLVLPGVFVFGLLLIPFGAWLQRRRQRAGKRAAVVHWPRLDLNDPGQRRVVFFIAVATLVNIVVISLAAYRGIEYMDSVTFCGQVCHEVMEPEFTAYHEGAHARVACVACHIGPGAPWFVRSKLSGTRQVFAVLLNTHPRPIPSPVENLRPARETCEQCHWPERATGDRIVTRRSYAADEANTETATTLRLHVGGGGRALRGPSGIHWHMSPSVQVVYVTTDRERQHIPFVRVEDESGRVREYRVPGTTDEQIAQGERRLMDCMDCHNRPSHPFAPTADAAIDEMLANGTLPASLPFAKREAVRLVTAGYASRDLALEKIAEGFEAFYRAEYPDIFAQRKAEVRAGMAAVQHAYYRNVFPAMNVRWGTYLQNIGHEHAPGCFRCHDDNHVAADGSTISQDCETCHEMLP